MARDWTLEWNAAMRYDGQRKEESRAGRKEGAGSAGGKEGAQPFAGRRAGRKRDMVLAQRRIFQPACVPRLFLSSFFPSFFSTIFSQKISLLILVSNPTR